MVIAFLFLPVLSKRSNVHSYANISLLFYPPVVPKNALPSSEREGQTSRKVRALFFPQWPWRALFCGAQRTWVGHSVLPPAIPSLRLV